MPEPVIFVGMHKCMPVQIGEVGIQDDVSPSRYYDIHVHILNVAPGQYLHACASGTNIPFLAFARDTNPHDAQDTHPHDAVARVLQFLVS